MDDRLNGRSATKSDIRTIIQIVLSTIPSLADGFCCYDDVRYCLHSLWQSYLVFQCTAVRRIEDRQVSLHEYVRIVRRQLITISHKKRQPFHFKLAYFREALLMSLVVTPYCDGHTVPHILANVCQWASLLCLFSERRLFCVSNLTSCSYKPTLTYWVDTYTYAYVYIYLNYEHLK